jgi:hypothetical protein
MVTFLLFVLACILSTWPGNFLIRTAYNRILSSVKGPVKDKTMKDWLEAISPDKDLAEFRSKTAWIIGALERFIFIYALMFSQPSLITGVLILKAFFAWTEHRARPDETDTDHAGGGNTGATQAADKSKMLETIAHYHTYVIGNFLSIVTAITVYHAVAWVPTLVEWLVHIIH